MIENIKTGLVDAQATIGPKIVAAIGQSHKVDVSHCENGWWVQDDSRGFIYLGTNDEYMSQLLLWGE
jgi:hypothetical protein